MKSKGVWLNIPNALSLVRLLLIPVIAWLYCAQDKPLAALGVLILSAVTDIADGVIARKFNQVSDLGKALDPVADKLTQMVTLLCLCARFPVLWIILGLLVVKEVITGAMSLYAVKKSGKVLSADWHGKVTTVLLYATMGLHMLWPGIPGTLSRILVALCVGMMLLSALLYAKRNRMLLKGENHG